MNFHFYAIPQGGSGVEHMAAVCRIMVDTLDFSSLTQPSKCFTILCVLFTFVWTWGGGGVVSGLSPVSVSNTGNGNPLEFGLVFDSTYKLAPSCCSRAALLPSIAEKSSFPQGREDSGSIKEEYFYTCIADILSPAKFTKKHKKALGNLTAFVKLVASCTKALHSIVTSRAGPFEIQVCCSIFS